MRLYIAGGCQEHGRNSFLLELPEYSILVDCGKKEGDAEPNPKLNTEQIRRIRYLFLTHSHKDHTGAVPWLIQQGFSGTILSAEETRVQMGVSYENWIVLPGAEGCASYQMDDMEIQYGKSGHCVGSIWILLKLAKKKILFTGDYSEQSVFYQCDRIRDFFADCAVMDCAYGNRSILAETAVHELQEALARASMERRTLLLPVPKYGRGMDFLSVIKWYHCASEVYGDVELCEQAQSEQGWKWSSLHLQESSRTVTSERSQMMKRIEDWNGEPAVLLIADPQLRKEKNQRLVKEILHCGGKLLLSGHLYPDTYAEKVWKAGYAEKIAYPVHQTYADVCTLVQKNQFSKIVLNHSEEAIDDRMGVAVPCKTGDAIVF